MSDKPVVYRKKRYNVDTLAVNALENVSRFGLTDYGAAGLDGQGPQVSSSKVLDRPRGARKRGTYISR